MHRCDTLIKSSVVVPSEPKICETVNPFYRFTIDKEPRVGCSNDPFLCFSSLKFSVCLLLTVKDRG